MIASLNVFTEEYTNVSNHQNRADIQQNPATWEFWKCKNHLRSNCRQQILVSLEMFIRANSGDQLGIITDIKKILNDIFNEYIW